MRGRILHLLRMSLLSLCIVTSAFSQTTGDEQAEESSQKDALKVFAEGGISHDYMKREITFVNYVRDPRMADVYLLITSQSTGSGGSEYTITYQGQNQYEGIDDTLTFYRNSTDTYEIYRSGLIKVIKRGFMRYVATTPTLDDIAITFEPSEVEKQPEEDKWRKWVFRVGCDVEIDVEKYEKGYQIDLDFSAGKVTENWKLTSYFSYQYSADQYEHGDRTIEDKRKELYVNSRLGRKIGEHWAIGISGNVQSDVRENDKLSIKASPEIEYNLYPYSEFSIRQFPIRIGLGLNHHDYFEETIYDKTSEFVGNLHMSAAHVIQGKWGSIINVLSGSFYLHDIRKNNFELVNIFDFRVFKGFSVNLLIVYDLIHDQLYLEKGDRTLEEVLLQRKQLETSYSYYVSLGFSYSFGSMYQNIVNPRFGY